MNFQPRDYQRQIIDHIKTHDHAFVLAQMGAGKSASCLQALKELPAPRPKRVLIIAPLRVAKSTWPAEIAKWDNFANFKYAVAIGSAKVRTAAILSGAPIVIINVENVPWLVENFAKQWKFDTVIIDESSAFKNSNTKRFKALRKMRQHPRINRWILMTATPTPNSMLEAWSQMYLLDEGKRLGRTFHSFKQRFFNSDYMGYKWEPKQGADVTIRNKIAELSVVVENYSGLPDRVDLNEYVQLTAKDYADYQALEKESLLGQDITAVNAAVLAGKLLQFASGAVYDDYGEHQCIHDEKIEALESLVEQAEGENILIAYNYKHELSRIKESFPDAVNVKDPDAIERWNRGEIKILLAHPASASHGLNLQDGGRRIIWFSPNWSNERTMQMNARLHRQGQTDHVFVHTIITQGTIDEEVVEVLAGKKSLQDALLNAVKRHSKGGSK